MTWTLFKKDEVTEAVDKKEGKVALSAPWIEHARKIYALFGKDPDIIILYNSETPEIKLFVYDVVKAEAIAELLPCKKDFGSVKLRITVVPPNLSRKASALAAAFNGNPIFSGIVTIEDAFDNPMTYISFLNEVVQYFDDNLGDLNGVKSTLYETIASDVLEAGEGIFYCTDIDEDSKIVWPED